MTKPAAKKESFRPKAERRPELKRPEDGPSQLQRENQGEILGGPNAVLAALKLRGSACRSLFLAEGRRASGGAAGQIVELARSLALPLKIVPRSALDRLCGELVHQGVAAVFDPLAYASESFLAELPEQGPAALLALDRIEDPGNLGALMRSAAAFGFLAVLAPKDRMAPLSSAALKAAAGAAESLPLVRVTNLRRSLDNLKDKGFWIVGADGDGQAQLSDFSFPSRSVLLLGSEGRGLSQLSQKSCDFVLAIEQRREAVSSLNVSVAGAILMHAYFCQHLAGSRL